MKEPTESAAELNVVEWEQLFSLIKEYNTYVEDRLKTIMDFDIWYEHTTTLDFPREWYSMIRESDSHK